MLLQRYHQQQASRFVFSKKNYLPLCHCNDAWFTISLKLILFPYFL